MVISARYFVASLVSLWQEIFDQIHPVYPPPSLSWLCITENLFSPLLKDKEKVESWILNMSKFLSGCRIDIHQWTFDHQPVSYCCSKSSALQKSSCFVLHEPSPTSISPRYTPPCFSLDVWTAQPRKKKKKSKKGSKSHAIPALDCKSLKQKEFQPPLWNPFRERIVKFS